MDVIITPKADKHLSKIPHNKQKAVEKKLSSLKKNPFMGKPLSGKLNGYYSIRIWPYRATYIISNKHKTIYIVSILHRQNAYK